MKRALIASLFLLPLAANAETYFGVGIGITKVDVASVAPVRDAILESAGIPCGSTGGAGTIRCAESVDDSDIGIKVFGGRRFDNIGVEGFYVDLGSVSSEATATDNSGTLLVRADADAKALGVAGVGFLPLGNYELFGKFGLARWSVDANAIITDGTTTFTDSASEDGIGPMLGIGIQFPFDSFSVRAEYEKFLDVGDENTTGESDVDLISVSIIFRL